MSQQGKVALSTIDVLGHTVVIVDRGEEREWFVPFATPAEEQKVDAYLLDEGYLADWFGEEEVQAVIDQARRDAAAEPNDQEAA